MKARRRPHRIFGAKTNYLSLRDVDRRITDLIPEFLVADLMFAVPGLCIIWTVKPMKLYLFLKLPLAKNHCHGTGCTQGTLKTCTVQKVSSFKLGIVGFRLEKPMLC